MTRVSLLSIVGISQMSPYGSIYMRANKTCKTYYIWQNKMVVILPQLQKNQRQLIHSRLILKET